MGATGSRHDDELTTAEALDLIRRFGEAGVPTLFMTGGEMFSRPDVWELLEAAHEQGIRLVVSTNGTLTSPTDIERLAGLGVDFAAISIYGPREFHDEYVVVPGAFDKIVETARRLREAGIGLCVKTTVNQDTLPHLPFVFETAKELGARVVYPCDLVTTGRASEMTTSAIGPEEWREIAELVIGEILEDPDGLEFDIGAQPSIVPYIAERLVEEGHSADEGLTRLHHMTACPVGHGHLAINARGDIMPCQFMQDYSIGNVRELDLAEAVETLFEMGRAEIGGECGECKHVTLCRGCRAKAHCMGGDVFGEDPTCLIPVEKRVSTGV
jgi:radical SAM protein with 4Fe4S-binding SPASM domain